MTTQEMIERYIYEVVRRLPAKQRDDTGRELRSLIDDMLEERGKNGKNGKTRQMPCVSLGRPPFSPGNTGTIKNTSLVRPISSSIGLC